MSKTKTILTVRKNKNDKPIIDIDADIKDIYGVVINLVGVLEESTGIEYNQILEDLKEIVKKDEN